MDHGFLRIVRYIDCHWSTDISAVQLCLVSYLQQMTRLYGLGFVMPLLTEVRYRCTGNIQQWSSLPWITNVGLHLTFCSFSWPGHLPSFSQSSPWVNTPYMTIMWCNDTSKLVSICVSLEAESWYKSMHCCSSILFEWRIIWAPTVYPLVHNIIS